MWQAQQQTLNQLSKTQDAIYELTTVYQRKCLQLASSGANAKAPEGTNPSLLTKTEFGLLSNPTKDVLASSSTSATA